MSPAPVSDPSGGRAVRPGLALRCAGYPEVRVDDRPVSLKLRHGLCLLVHLAELDRKVARVRLAELLWPDTPIETARTRLRRLCHEVNAAVGFDAITGDADALWLDRGRASVASDVAQVRAAAMAVLGTRSAADVDAALDPLLPPGAHDLMAGFDAPSDAFGEWLDERRAEQERLLIRALGHAAQTLLDGDRPARAADAAARIVRLDPLADAGHVLRLEALARLGQAAAVDAAYLDCAELLRDELGIRPSAPIEAAYARARERLAGASGIGRQPGAQAVANLRFADASDGSVAFLELGDPQARAGTLIISFGLWSHVEVAWEEPRIRAILARLAERFRVVLMDRRGVGLSERIAQRHGAAAGAEDIEAVRRTLGVDRVWLFGNSVGGMISIEYAAAFPQHAAGLVLFGTAARGTRADDHPWGLTAAQVDAWLQLLHSRWGSATSLEQFAPSLAGDVEARGWWARMLRQAATRNGLRLILQAFGELDVRSRLAQVRAPALVVQRSGDLIVREGAARDLAQRIAGCELQVLPGADHLLWAGDADAVLQHIERFVDRRAERIG